MASQRHTNTDNCFTQLHQSYSTFFTIGLHSLKRWNMNSFWQRVTTVVLPDDTEFLVSSVLTTGKHYTARTASALHTQTRVKSLADFTTVDLDLPDPGHTTLYSQATQAGTARPNTAHHSIAQLIRRPTARRRNRPSTAQHSTSQIWSPHSGPKIQRLKIFTTML